MYMYVCIYICIKCHGKELGMGKGMIQGVLTTTKAHLRGIPRNGMVLQSCPLVGQSCPVLQHPLCELNQEIVDLGEGSSPWLS
jgi:hypothetical protein